MKSFVWSAIAARISFESPLNFHNFSRKEYVIQLQECLSATTEARVPTE